MITDIITLQMEHCRATQTAMAYRQCRLEQQQKSSHQAATEHARELGKKNTVKGKYRMRCKKHVLSLIQKDNLHPYS